MTAGDDDEVRISLFCHICPVKLAILEVVRKIKNERTAVSNSTQLLFSVYVGFLVNCKVNYTKKATHFFKLSGGSWQ